MEELDLKELFEIFWSRKIYILIITLVFIIVGFIYTYLFTTPKYKSETSLLLVKQDATTTSSSSITTSDLTLSQKLVSTYSELIRSKLVLEPVIESLEMNTTVDQLKSTITVSSVKDTELIKISVVNENAKNAKIIANQIVKVFSEKVKDIYKIDNVSVIDAAEVSETPYNINHAKDIIIFASIGLVISIVYVLVANMLDTTVKSKETIESKIGLSVLTEIPLCDFSENGTKAKGGKK